MRIIYFNIVYKNPIIQIKNVAHKIPFIIRNILVIYWNVTSYFKMVLQINLI